jgi:hypothetical protein
MFGARRAILAALLATVAALAVQAPTPASASGGQVALFEDDVGLLQNPGPTLQELRHLGVTMVRLGVRWSFIAPNANSRTRPRFNASDPNSYPAKNWAPYDTVVRTARADGIQVMFVPTAFAPLWAQGANPGRFGARYNPDFAFMPKANEFKQFVQAVGRRYPTIHTWELYNEPNFGEDLAPQAIKRSQVLYSPVMYRGLLNAAWAALHSTGHGRDTILIGALAARGNHIPFFRGGGLPGTYGETPPLEFIRELYCLTSRYQPYQGAAARMRSCPVATAGKSRRSRIHNSALLRRFRAQNPALFNSSGWSIHPYPLGKDGGTPPTTTHYHNPNYADFSQLPNMFKTLDRVQRAYRSRKHFSVWNTEYGYITNPPNRTESFVSPVTQAFFNNWAEYLSWKRGRLASAMQYLLYDPNPSIGTPECGGFASGLVFFSFAPTSRGCSAYQPGTPKPGLNAYRLPIYLPTSSTRRGRPLTVWGCVRPARFAILDTHQPQTAQIQFLGASGTWTTVATVTYTNPNGSCYFTRQVTFPASGSVRLAYSYPASDFALMPGIPETNFSPQMPAVSRTVTVTVF